MDGRDGGHGVGGTEGEDILLRILCRWVQGPAWGET